MNPDTFNFIGDAVTYLGFVGVVSTLIILVTAFRRYFNSPYNLKSRPIDPNPEDCMPPWGHSDLEYLVNHPEEVSNEHQS